MAHMEDNDQIKVTNRTIAHAIAIRLDVAKGRWVDELLNVLRVYRTTPQTATKETPFSLVYRLKSMISLELMVLTERKTNFNQSNNDNGIRTNLELSMDRREIPAI